MEAASLRFGSGQPVRRIEDDALLTGRGRFTDDINDDAAYPGHLRLCFVRSPYPHARIAALDKSAAQAMPGVLAVYDGEDLAAAGVKPIPRPAVFKRADGSPVGTPVRYLLARESVRFVGEPVAVVVAETLEQARNAAEAVPQQSAGGEGGRRARYHRRHALRGECGGRRPGAQRPRGAGAAPADAPDRVALVGAAAAAGLILKGST